MPPEPSDADVDEASKEGQEEQLADGALTSAPKANVETVGASTETLKSTGDRQCPRTPSIAVEETEDPNGNQDLSRKGDSSEKLEQHNPDSSEPVNPSSSISRSVENVTNDEHGEDEEESNDDDEEDEDDDDEGPPPLALEQQPINTFATTSGGTPTRRRAPPARLSSQSSQDSMASGTRPWFATAGELFRNSSTNSTIPLMQLRKLASQGSLDNSHRGLSWRLLLGYLDPDKSKWKSQLHEKRQVYHDFVQELFVHPTVGRTGAQLKQQPRRGKPQLTHSKGSVDVVPSAVTTTVNATSSSKAIHTLVAPELPSALREAWKRSGRDLHVLESLTTGVNALRLPTTTGVETDTTVRHAPDRHQAPPTSPLFTLDRFVTTASLLDEIRKDINRTCCDLAFYLDPMVGSFRYAVLERILLVWAIFHSPVKYVQGMNEIVAVLYFVLSMLEEEEDDDDGSEDNSDTDFDTAKNDGSGDDAKMESDEEPPAREDAESSVDTSGDASAQNGNDWESMDWADYAEPDAYWLFHALLSEMSDVFVPDMDKAETGIHGRITAMQDLLKRHDEETAEHLQELGIDANFYAVRWWTTLLSREFLLPDTIRLWDSMFASTHKDNFIRYVCVTMVLVVRDSLLKGDFSTCLRLLQKYPPTNMEHLLQSSRALWVYESQITVACHRGGIGLSQALQAIAPPPGVVFAFGLRNGLLVQPPDLVADQPSWGSNASGSAEQKVREATQVVATQAQVFLGRAMGLYRKYRSSNSSDQNDSNQNVTDNNDGLRRSASDKVDAETEDSPSVTPSSSAEKPGQVELPPDHPDDSIYLEAILKA